MAAELTQDPQLILPAAVDFEIPHPPKDLIFDDGEPLESSRHRIAMNALIASVHEAFADRDDYFVGGNMFLYYSEDQAMNRDFRGPDFFVTLNVDRRRERKYWAIWEEQGRYPDVIVELMSPSTRQVDLTVKKQLYAQTFRTREYFVYDPFEADSLQGWRLDAADRYQDIAKSEQGWCWCQELDLWLGCWLGELTRETAPWLRFYDAEGNLVLLPEEREQRRAELAENQRDLERQRAELAENQRDLERQEREQERQARLDSVLRLLALGLGVAEVAAALDLSVAVVEQVRDSQAT